jgi:hypothetical protein
LVLAKAFAEAKNLRQAQLLCSEATELLGELVAEFPALIIDLTAVKSDD